MIQTPLTPRARPAERRHGRMALLLLLLLAGLSSAALTALAAG